MAKLVAMIFGLSAVTRHLEELEIFYNQIMDFQTLRYRKNLKTYIIADGVISEM